MGAPEGFGDRRGAAEGFGEGENLEYGTPGADVRKLSEILRF